MIKHILTGIVAISTMVMGGEISSISPSTAALGTENLTVTFKLSAGSEEQGKADQQSEQSDSDNSSSRGGGRRGGPGGGGQGGRGGRQGGPGQGGQRPDGLLPPVNVLPKSVTIGSISGTSVTHASMDTVTAVFDIPLTATAGTNTVTITFTDPMGKDDVYTSDDFTIK